LKVVVVVVIKLTSCGSNLTDLDVEPFQVEDDVQPCLSISVVKHFVGCILKDMFVSDQRSFLSGSFVEPVLLQEGS